jgi:hypothetical protein
VISRHSLSGQELASCEVGDGLVAEAIGGIVGVDVVGLAIGELEGPIVDGPIVGEDVIGIVTGEFDGEIDAFLVGEDVGEIDAFLVGEDVGEVDGPLVGEDVGLDDGEGVGDDVIVGGDGLVVSSMNVIGGGDGLVVGSSPTEQILDVHDILLLYPQPVSQQAPLSISGAEQSLNPLL